MIRDRSLILVVEDEVMINLYIATILEGAGYSVLTAIDGEQGYKTALSERPDLILTDFMMPRLDGLAMLRQLRKKGIDCPAIVSSAVPRAQLPVAGGEPFDAYLAKPVSDTGLTGLIGSLLRPLSASAG